MFPALPSPPGVHRLVALGIVTIVLVGWVPISTGAFGGHTAFAVPSEHSVAAPTATHPTPTPVVRSAPPSSRTPAPVFHGLGPGAYRSGGVTPASWRGAKLPPGAPIPLNLVNPQDNWSGGNGTNWSALAKYCFGVWPTDGGQAQYIANCYGHDEPGLDAYSSLPGSGGNVTWNVTLPTDRNDTEVQAALYSAIWFGMTLADPYAWMDQCFLEVQLYPDSAWSSTGGANGNWVGAAVAWQIEADTGAENPCFYQQLAVRGTGAFFNMFQGDHLQVTLAGWTGSPYGENLTIVDLTEGLTSFTNLYNSALDYPLDPAYSTSSFGNALQWTPGVELPVSFAFETGHTNGASNTNQYGGCSPGTPQDAAVAGSVPCPSYDPGSWVNDSVSPWLISPPTFFNAHARAQATQMAFTQDFSGILLDDSLSNGACTGSDGSAWCSYPWWSYSCLWGAFEFGAADFPGVTDDFGQYTQYARQYLVNADGLGYFPPTNVSVPSCGGPEYTIATAVSGGNDAGAVQFLSSVTFSTTNVTPVSPGLYSLSATPSYGYRFLRWTITGGAQVDFATSPWASLNVTGNATVTAVFGTSAPPSVKVRFDDEGGHGWQVVAPGLLVSALPDTTTVGVNGSISLIPGAYSILSYPKPGYNFTSWASNNSGGAVAAPPFPFTWLIITGSDALVQLNVSFVKSTSNGSLQSVVLQGNSGSATMTFDGQSLSNGGGIASLRVGTYPLVITPGSGTLVQSITTSGAGISIDQHDASNISLEGGTTIVQVTLVAAAIVTVATAGGAGNVSIGGQPFVGNGEAVPMPNQFAPTTYSLLAVPPAGEAFSHWSVSNSADLWVLTSFVSTTSIRVNSSATLTAHFVPDPTVDPIEIRLIPAGAGQISINGGAWTSATPEFFNWTPGDYLFEVAPGPQSTASWVVAGAVSYSPAGASFPAGAKAVGFGGGIGWVNITFSRPPGVFFNVDVAPSDAAGTIKVDGVARAVGDNILLTPGLHSFGASFPAPLSLAGYHVTSNLSIVGTGFGTSLDVQGSGTIYAVSSWPIDLTVAANVTRGHSPLNVSFTSTVIGAKSPWLVQWNFQDGNRSSGPDANHTFTVPGFYNVTTTVVDSLGGGGSAVTFVHVLPPTLTALASANVTSGFAPLTVGFTGHGSSGVPPYTFNWTFGDGNRAVGVASAAHTYDVPGTFTATFFVNDSARQHTTATITVLVRSSLTASIIASADHGTTPLTVQFFGSGHLGNPPYTYAWGFGDGVQGSGANVTYTYRVAGVYNVSLLVGDRFGSVASSFVLVNATTIFVPLTVSLLESSGNITYGDPVTVRATPSGGQGPYTYTWQGLPPGCSASGPTWTCRPSLAGDYMINVTVGDSLPTDIATAGTELIVYQPTGPGTPGGNPTQISGFSTGSTLPYIAIGALVAAAAVGWLLYRRRSPPADPGPVDEPEPDRFTT